MSIKLVTTDKAPAPAGHYSQATVHNDVVYVAGQLGVVPGTKERKHSVADQTEQALRNVQAILLAAGSDLSRVLRVTVYVVDIAYWKEVNIVYARVFRSHRPARAVVPCNPLHHGLLVEIEAVAALA